VVAATRRIGEWTFAEQLTRIAPEEGEPNPHGAGYEVLAEAGEAAARELGHDNPVNETTGFRWSALNILIKGAADSGAPGVPSHAGTEAVSWGSVKLVATAND